MTKLPGASHSVRVAGKLTGWGIINAVNTGHLFHVFIINQLSSSWWTSPAGEPCQFISAIVLPNDLSCELLLHTPFREWIVCANIISWWTWPPHTSWSQAPPKLSPPAQRVNQAAAVLLQQCTRLPQSHLYPSFACGVPGCPQSDGGVPGCPQ